MPYWTSCGWMRLLRKDLKSLQWHALLKGPRSRDFHNSSSSKKTLYFFGEMFHQRNCLHVVNQKYNPLNILYFSKIKHSSTLTKTYMCYNWKQNAVICRVCGHDIRTQCISTQSSSDTWEGWHADIWVVVIMTPIQILGCYVHRKIKSTHAPELQNTLAAQHK